MPEAEAWYVKYVVQIVIVVAVPILGGLGWLLKRWLERRATATQRPSISQKVGAAESVLAAGRDLYLGIPSDSASEAEQIAREIIDQDKEKVSVSGGVQETTKQLKETIKANLYAEDDKLPYVLLQCLELANSIASAKDVEWIMMELRGYPTEAQREVDARDEPYEPAQYRVIPQFFRVAFGHLSEIDEWPYRPAFYPKPVSQIIRTIRGARSQGTNEVFSTISISDYEDLSELATKIGSPPGGKLRLFIKLSELEGILDGLRARIAAFLQQVG